MEKERIFNFSTPVKSTPNTPNTTNKNLEAPSNKNLFIEPIQTNSLEDNSKKIQNDTQELLNTITTKLNKMKEDVKNKETTNTFNITEMKKNIDTVIGRLKNIETNSSSNDEKLKEALESKEILKNDIIENNQLITNLQKTIQEQTNQISNMENKKSLSVDEKEQQIAQLKSQINEKEKQIQIKNNDINILKKSKGNNDNEINNQISQLQVIQNQLNGLNRQVEGQGKSIDGSFDQFNKQIIGSNDIVSNIDSTVRNVGTMIGSFFTMGGGKKKKKATIKYHKRSRTTLNKIAKKWGISNIRKYKSKSQLLAVLTLIVVYKVKSIIYNKKDLLIIAKNLDLKVGKIKKKDLENIIDKKTRKFSIKDLY